MEKELEKILEETKLLEIEFQSITEVGENTTNKLEELINKLENIIKDDTEKNT